MALAYCDTSTGVRNDVAAMARVSHAREALLLVEHAAGGSDDHLSAAFERLDD